MSQIDHRIDEWRAHLLRREAVRAEDVDELEDHLRSQVADLRQAGLSEDEAFLIAVRRMGSLDSISREFAQEYSERLWKRLVVAPESGAKGGLISREVMVAVGLAVAAAATIKAPELFGMHISGPEGMDLWYARHLSLFVFPWLAVFFAWKRELEPRGRMLLAVPFVLAVAAINAIPYAQGGHTELLAILHLPMAMWLAVGFAYTGGRWRDVHQRMNFVRFSGETFIYYVLIAMGGGVLMGLTMFIFSSIGMDAETALQLWILPCGATGAVLIAGWLAEAKQSVIENMAPVLTHIFTPLFTVLLLIFLGTMAVTGSGIGVEREVLIGFDLLLVLVVGLVLYAISARDPQARPGFFDGLQLLLVVSALLVDVMALWAILARINEFGFSPNRVAALGENLILLANLAGAAVLYGRFLRGKTGFAAMERWQMAFLPVYAVWAVVVVVIFPFVFSFI